MNELTIQEATKLNVAVIKDATLLKEVKELDRINNEVLSLYGSTKDALNRLKREQAPVLYRIVNGALYKKDGYKTMSEFCEAINMSPSGLSATVAAGRVYSDPKAPDELKALPVFTIGQMSKLINDDDMRKTVYADAKEGKLNGITQKTVKDEYVKDVEGRCGKAKTKIVKTYTVTANGETLDAPPATIEEWEDGIKAKWGNVVKVPDIENHKALIGYSSVESCIYILSEYVAPKAKVAVKTDYVELIKIVTRKVRRNEELTDNERELAISIGLIDEDEVDEAEDN